jgi:hypothetical protein
MKLKFIGKYNGPETISYPPYTFVGREPLEVDPETDMGRRLCGNREFEEVHPLDHDGNGEPGGSLSGDNATAKKRGRPKKEI